MYEVSYRQETGINDARELFGQSEDAAEELDHSADAENGGYFCSCFLGYLLTITSGRDRKPAERGASTERHSPVHDIFGVSSKSV